MANERESKIKELAEQVGIDMKKALLPNLLHHSGRYYCYPDNRWVTGDDDNYGANYYQNNENAGTGADPLLEWEHNGIPIPKGRRVKSITIVARTNNTEITDIEFAIYKKIPNPISRWETGFDNDSEDITTELYRNFWWENTETGQPTFSGNTNDKHARTFVMDSESDANLWEELGELVIYAKPVGTNTANRYFMYTRIIEVN